MEVVPPILETAESGILLDRLSLCRECVGNALHLDFGVIGLV